MYSSLLGPKWTPTISVCMSITFHYCVQTNKDMIVWFSASGRTTILVFEEVEFIRIFAGDHSAGAIVKI